MLFGGYGRLRLFIVSEMSFIDFVTLDAFGGWLFLDRGYIYNLSILY